MAWGHKWGDRIDFYYMLRAKGTLRPEDVAPEVGPFGLYIEAFNELSTCRPGSMGGISAIPFVAVVEYAKLYGIEGEELDELLYIIRRMDAELIQLESKKQGNQNGSKGSKGNRSKG